MKTTSAAVLLVLESVVLFQLAVAWDDFDDKFRLDKKVVDDNNIFGSDFEWWKRQEDFEIERSDKEGALPYPLVDFDSTTLESAIQFGYAIPGESYATFTYGDKTPTGHSSSNIGSVVPRKRNVGSVADPLVTFNPSKVTKPTYVPPTYQPAPPRRQPSTSTTPRPTEAAYPYYHQETGVRQHGVHHPGVHQETGVHHGYLHPNYQAAAPHHSVPVSHQSHEEEANAGNADVFSEVVPNFTSFSQNVNQIRDEYNSQKQEKKTKKVFAPSATENAPLAPVTNTEPPTTSTVGSRQKSNSGKVNAAYPQKQLKKVVRKKRYRPRAHQPDFSFGSFGSIGSTLDSAIGRAVGSVEKLLGGVTRSANNNLQFEKFQQPFVPSATLQPADNGNQQKRETVLTNFPEKDGSGISSAIKQITPPPQTTHPNHNYHINEPKATSGSNLNLSLNENSGKTTSHHKATAIAAAPITPQGRPQQPSFAPYRRKSPGGGIHHSGLVRDILLVTDSLNNMIFGRGSRRNGRQRAVAPVGGDQAAPVPTYASAYSSNYNHGAPKGFATVRGDNSRHFVAPNSGEIQVGGFVPITQQPTAKSQLRQRSHWTLFRR